MKPRKKKSTDSLLGRLFGGGKKKGKGKGKKGNNSARKKAAESAPKEKPRPLTRMERSIAEIKQMANIGEKDPERLAHMLAALLAKEREKQQADQENFEQQVWEIVRRSEDGDAPPDGEGPPDGGESPDNGPADDGRSGPEDPSSLN